MEKTWWKRWGGVISLDSAVAHIPGVTISELADGGASIRIGDQPQLGDTHKGNTLETYRALGKVLNPLRNRHAVTTGMSVPGMRERDHPGLRAKWLDRFFPE
ncbi:type VI immunity family protein [Massilia rubra]|uniref:type VI immunity family protein n=1 Tax=Massilia rubra TaxID=2607910 RepID=UPI001421EE30|nr:type VI immunity family protein [Massilia rubra]